MSGCMVRPNRKVFVVYAGLTASGYHTVLQSSSEPAQALVEQIRSLKWPEEALAYFQKARTETCAVNPYWPRAFLLTVAALRLSDTCPCRYGDEDQIVRHIEDLDMIGPEDRSPDTIEWILDLPRHCDMLAAQPGLDQLWEQYLAAIDIGQHEKAVAEAMSAVIERVGVSPDQLPTTVVIPNPLQAREVTDFVRFGGETLVVRAEPDAASCVHEILHQVFGPRIVENRAIVQEYSHLLASVYPDMLRLRYAWDNGDGSWERVFEESLMRAAEIWITHSEEDCRDADRAATFQAGCGFKYVPAILQFFRTKWSGLDRFGQFLARCLEGLAGVGFREER